MSTLSVDTITGKTAATKVKLPAGSEFILKSGKVQKTTTVVVEPYWLKNMSVFKNALVEDVFFELEKTVSN